MLLLNFVKIWRWNNYSYGRITTDLYNKKLKEYKERQQEILEEIQKYNKADESFYITVNKVLSLAQRAYEIFESSEIEEKRQLLNFVLQNFKLKERKLMFKTKTPSDTVSVANKCSNWGLIVDAFRTVEWGNIKDDMMEFNKISFWLGMR